MTIDEFLSRNVTGYLINDLKSMSVIEEPQSPGGVNYPMIMTILAGVELLGTLLNPAGPFKIIGKRRVLNGDDHFRYFWNQYLAQFKPKYKPFNNLFYRLLRNGIAHTFLVKHYIYVYKTTEEHLNYSKTDPRLDIGCVEFGEDFINVYENKVLTILNGGDESEKAKRESMQLNLDKVLEHFENESAQEFNSLPNIHESGPIIQRWTPTSGASLSVIDLPHNKQVTTPSGIQMSEEYEKRGN